MPLQAKHRSCGLGDTPEQNNDPEQPGKGEEKRSHDKQHQDRSFTRVTVHETFDKKSRSRSKRQHKSKTD